MSDKWCVRRTDNNHKTTHDGFKEAVQSAREVFEDKYDPTGRSGMSDLRGDDFYKHGIRQFDQLEKGAPQSAEVKCLGASHIEISPEKKKGWFW